MSGQWWRPRDSKDITPRPWLNDKAVEYFEGQLSPDSRVLEFGAGGSTLWLSERVAYVETYDDDQDWMRIVKAQTGDNVKVLSHEAVNFASLKDFDIVFIDGEPVTERCEWLVHAPLVVKPGGMIILDNANRPEYAQEREGLKQYATLEYTANGNEGATLYLVTEFWRTHATGQKPDEGSESRDIEADNLSGDIASAEFLWLSREAIRSGKRVPENDDAERADIPLPVGVG